MDGEDSHIIETTSITTLNEARDRLHAIMTTDITEAIVQIDQTLEACNAKKARLFEQLDEVSKVIAIVRKEWGCIDTTIGSKILHLNKLVTQIVQQMALVNISDPPPPLEPTPTPAVEIDLSAVHDRLNDLDQMVNHLTKLILEKEETVLYIINKRPGHGEISTSIHSPMRVQGIPRDREEQIHEQMTKLQTLVENIQSEDENHSQEIHQHHKDHHSHRIKQLSSHLLSASYNEDDSSRTNGQRSNNQINHNNEDDEEISQESDQTTIGRCTLCLPERTEEMTSKRSYDHHSITSSDYTDRSISSPLTSHNRGLGEALASNGKDIIYYDYEKGMICMAETKGYSIKFHHGLVVDLYWWSLNSEWLILSEQGLYRWKSNENEYHDAYEFSNGEIGFRRIAVTDTSIFCLFRYSLMLLELSNAVQMKRLHALAPPDTQYRKLADISVRKKTRFDGSEEDVLGLIWFGSGPGILLEERYVTIQENNFHERLFRHVPIHQGRYARLASFQGGRAWLISNTGTDVLWFVDNADVSVGRWEASVTWVKVTMGIPINAVGFTSSTVCIRLQNGELQFLESEH